MILDADSLMGRKVATAVKVNGLFVPVDYSPKILSAYSEPVIFYNSEHPEFEVSRRGTMVKLRIGERFFALTTSHQTFDFDFDQLGIITEIPKSITTSGACIYSSCPKFGEEQLDCRLFDFTEPVASGKLRSTCWLELTAEWLNSGSADAELLMAIGYPDAFNDLDYAAKNMTVQPYAALGWPIDPMISNRCTFECVRSLEVDPSGMSGAPVYGYSVSGTGAFVTLEGLVTNASKSLFNYLPKAKIKKYLNHALAD